MRLYHNLRKRGLALFMALVMCLSLLPTTAMAEEVGSGVGMDPVPNLTPTEVGNDDVTIKKSAARVVSEDADPGTWAITMEITAKETLQSVPLEFVLAIDVSGSMDSNRVPSGDTRFKVARESAQKLLDDLNGLGRDIRVAVVAFRGTYTEICPMQSLAGNIGTIKAVIGKLNQNTVTSSNTNITSGLRGAAAELGTVTGTGTDKTWKLNSLKNPDIAHAIVLLSDGDPTPSKDPEYNANGLKPGITNEASTIGQIKAKGIEVFTVGFGERVPVLQSIASEPVEDHYKYATDKNSLDGAFADFKTKLTAMVNDPMGDHVSMDQNSLKEALSSGQSGGKFTTSNNKNFSWDAEGNEIVTTTKTITYTVSWDALDAQSDVSMAAGGNLVDLNGDAKFTYSKDVNGVQTPQKPLSFPIPKDVVQVAQLTTTYEVTDSQGNSVDVSRTDFAEAIEKAIVQWKDENDAATFEADKYGTENPSIEINGTTYYWVGSTYDEEDSIPWNTDGTAVTTAEPGEHKLVHKFAEKAFKIEKAAVVKTPAGKQRTGEAKVGDIIEYTITVTNLTDAELSDIKVADSLVSEKGVGNEDGKVKVTSGTWSDTDKAFTIDRLTKANPVEIKYTYTVLDSDKGTSLVNVATSSDPGSQNPPKDDPKPEDPNVTETDVEPLKLTSVVKTVADRNNLPKDITDTGYTWPDANGNVELPESGSVTLLYKVIVTGDAGAKYVVTDKDATYVTGGGEGSGGATATGTIPAVANSDGSTDRGTEKTVDLYFSRTFSSLTSASTGVSNTVYLTSGNKETTKVEAPDNDPKNPDPDAPKDENEKEEDFKKSTENTGIDQGYTITVKYMTDKDVAIAIPVTVDNVTKYVFENSTGKLANGTVYMATVKGNGWIPAEFVTADGQHYILDKVNGKENITVTKGQTTDGTINGADVEIEVVYTLDDWDKENPETPDPNEPGDKVPDKYQVKVIYRVKENSAVGYVQAANEEKVSSKTVILDIARGTSSNHVTEGYVNLPAVTAVPGEATRFTGWTVGIGSTGKASGWPPVSGTNAALKGGKFETVKGGEIYIAEASFDNLNSYNVVYKFVYKDADGNVMTATASTPYDNAVKAAGITKPDNTTLLENVPKPDMPDTPENGTKITLKDGNGLTSGYLLFESWEEEPSTDRNVTYKGTWVYHELKDNPDSTLYALIYDSNYAGEIERDTANSPLDTHTFTVTDKAPTRENYIFKGWAESATANTGDVAYAAGKSVTLTSAAPTKTLYAVWEPIATYTVEYQWAASAPASISRPAKETGFHSGDSFTPTISWTLVPVYYGGTQIGTWTFGGWFHDKACSEPYPATITKDEIVYGKWTYEAAETTDEIQVTKIPNKTEAAVGETVTWTITVTNPKNGRNYTSLDLADMLDGASVSDQSAAIGNGWYLNPGYDIPEEPEKSVYTLTIEYQYADGTEAAETCIMNLPAGEPYFVASPEIPGYEANIPVVTGTMSNPAGTNPGTDTTVTVVYTPKLYTLTINYVNATGSQVADPYIADLAAGEEYSVTSPEVAGYTPAQLVVAGTMPSGDVSETVTYSSAPVIPDTSEDVQDDSQEPQMEMAEATEMALAAPDGGLNPHDFSLAPGAVAVFEISYKVQPGDGKQLINRVTVTEPGNPEPIGKNDPKPVDVLHPNLVVAKVKDSDSPDPAKVGDTITWTITITNTGDGTAYDVYVTDENADNLSQRTIASLAPGDWVTIYASHAVTGSEALEDGKFYNTVIASYKEEDPAKKDPTDPPEDPKETTGKDEGTEIPVALAVQKSANVTTAVNPGSYVTYTITVTNSGHDAENVTVTDVLDSRLTFVSAALNGSPITPNDSVYSVGAVTNAAPAILTITVRVNDNVANNEVIPNVAAATYPNNPEEPEPSNPVNVPVTVPSVIIPDIPFTPTPTPPTIITPTPTPTTGGTTITDEETPLGGSVGLNDTDHFAYVIGYEDDTVRPLNNITRAEAATIFFRLMTDEFRQEHWATTNDFSDVKAGDWYNNAISTCANAGVLKGYDDGTFRPNAPITRAEFASMAAGFMDESITDDGTGDFSDTASHWAAAAIRRAAKAGWVTGTGNKFNPDARITRAEVMTIVNRMLDRTPDKDHMLPEMKKWIDNPESEWYYEAVQEATNEHDYERDELNVETWTELLTVRDWAALETEWANNGGASAPKADDTAVDQRRVPDGI